jgi:hypothetical protein
MTAEHDRLDADRLRAAYWKRWGPYVSDRAWGTVREDYSADGEAWDYLPYDHARSRAYRWNEDGIAGICDRHQTICFALALWNGRDPEIKERLFGLSNRHGNHGEDVKEYYFHLDSTPTHSYMKFLYKYPQAAFPYEQLLEVNRRRGREQPEYELHETGVFRESRYFDVFVEYAKETPEDILVQITVANRGPDSSAIHILPTVWFRNTWSWEATPNRPVLRVEQSPRDGATVALHEPKYGRRWLYCEGDPALLFTDNETNTRRLFGIGGPRYAKDGINDFVAAGRADAVNPEQQGTKAAAHYVLNIPGGGERRLRLRLTDRSPDRFTPSAFGLQFDQILALRRREADEFFDTVIPSALSHDERTVMRQALAGLLWSKQFYHYVVKTWLEGDPATPPPPSSRKHGRNSSWLHLYNADVISMPDKWEYPWYASWDLAFHCIPLTLVDPDYAKQQLVLLLREWYMHPNGQLPAYEWSFSDVNPPVHAWAAWRVYKIDKSASGVGDRVFLERVFQKLLLNFTWWVNRKDADGRNVFQGGFLGLDNIGVFDRSHPLPTGGSLQQSDGTSWMAMYCLNMLAMAIELADGNPAYEDMATKFWEHFLYIAAAMGHRGGEQDDVGLWDEVDGFFYDVLQLPSGHVVPLRIRSAVGLIPLFAVETLEAQRLKQFGDFNRRLEWFVHNRPDLTAGVASMTEPGRGQRRLLSVMSARQLRRVLQLMLDETEFLSEHGVRAMSRFHARAPYEVLVRDTVYKVEYEPAESGSAVFGGNSNWRGPVWFPLNYLIVESLQKFHHYFGDSFTVECPTRSGRHMTLQEVSAELSRRLAALFLRRPDGTRPINGGVEMFDKDRHWRDHVFFHEYFHGDTGIGLGASHQTGWTALIAKLLQKMGRDAPGEASDATVTLRL